MCARASVCRQRRGAARVRFGRVEEVPAHHGQFCVAVGAQWLLFLSGGQLSRFCGQPQLVVGAAGQLFGKGRHLRAIGGWCACDHPVGQA